jgi:large subunit ribosomal protein L18
MAKFKRKIRGNAIRPRVAVSRSAINMEIQAINDDSGETILGLSTKSLDEFGGNVKGAVALGREFSVQLLAKGVESIVFDRRRFVYHGRVKAVAESMRENGLKF